MPKGESLFHKYPDYRVEVEPQRGRVVVSLGGETLADSTRALRLLETKHAPVVYVPRADVRMDRLEASEHHSFCPFKGEASYFSVRAGGLVEVDAVWTYEDPFPEVAALGGLLAFYTDRLRLEEMEIPQGN